MFVLDTNVISAIRRPERARQVARWLASKAEGDLFLSVITIGEIARGIAQARRRDPEFAADLQSWLDQTIELFSDRILAFEAEDALIWGRLSNEIGHPGADLMIAATALRHDAVVVTGNTADFEPTGARIENPF